jgi:hypothetical protein
MNKMAHTMSRRELLNVLILPPCRTEPSRFLVQSTSMRLLSADFPRSVSKIVRRSRMFGCLYLQLMFIDTPVVVRAL